MYTQLKMLAGVCFNNTMNSFIHFTDQGKGMDKEEMKDAFRPFYSDFNEGTGLGLSIAQRIVELHRGRILIESEPNKGSTFTVELPVQLKSE